MELGALGQFLPNLNFSGIGSTIFNSLKIAGIIAVFALASFLIWRYKNKGKQAPLKEIHWWEEIQGQMRPIRVDFAKEISIPGTNLKLFYIKDKDTWLPRFTRGVAPNVYYVCITENKEIVNFSLKSLNKDLSEAGLAYDHTDMRWAAENMREFVKRNFKDKSEKWWKAYQGVISTVLYLVAITFCFVIIIYFMRGIVQDLGAVSGSITSAIDRLEMCVPRNSGVIQQ